MGSVKFFKKNGGTRAYDSDAYIYKLRSSGKDKPTKYYICIK